MTSRLKLRHEARLDDDVVTSRLVPLAGIAPVPFASSSHERSRELLEEAFDNGMFQIRFGSFVVFHDCSSFLVLVVSDHFSNDPVATPINATGHQLVTLYRSICAEKRAQILEPLMAVSFVAVPSTYVPWLVFILCLVVHRIR